MTSIFNGTLIVLVCSQWFYICIGQFRRYDFVACDFCSARYSRHAKIVYNFHHLTLSVATTCRRVLKHVSKSYDIFCVIYDNRKRVVGLIYTTKSYRLFRPYGTCTVTCICYYVIVSVKSKSAHPLGQMPHRLGLHIRWPACKESRVRQPGASGFFCRLVDYILRLPDGQAFGGILVCGKSKEI